MATIGRGVQFGIALRPCCNNIMQHRLDKGFSFKVEDPELFRENTKFWHNAEIVLNEIVATFEGGGPVKI